MTAASAQRPSRDTLEAALARLAADQALEGIFLHLCAETARREADAADDRAARGLPLGPLDGALFAAKGSMHVAGMPWTQGTARWRERHADRDAACVAAMRGAGAVLLGTTNLDEFSLSATGRNPVFGDVPNPAAPERSAGGSSGGSAAAVAADLVRIGLGGDTLGSIRIPAAWCGIAGLKPSAGRVNGAGAGVLSRTLDVIGPMARRVRDLVSAMDALAQLHPVEPGPEIRVVVPTDLGTVGAETAAAMEQATRALTTNGIEVVRTALDWSFDAGRRAGLLIVESEAAEETPDLLDGVGVSGSLHGMLAFGRDLPFEKRAQAHAVRRAAGDCLADVLSDADALLLPVTPAPPFAADAPVPKDQAAFTALANLAGAPAVALPTWAAGLPVGVQLVGRPHGDAALLGIACRAEAALSGETTHA